MICAKCGSQNVVNANFCGSCGCAMSGNACPDGQAAAERGAGFWKRFVALLIDSMVLSIGGMIIGGIIGGIIGFVMGLSGTDIDTITLVAGAVGYLLGIVINWLYYTLMESSTKQATLGKMALGIVVADLEGSRISFGKANGRYWGKILSAIIFCIGFIMAAFTGKKQALHDMLAGTLVVNK